MSYPKETKDFHFFQPLKRNPGSVKVFEDMYSLDDENLYLTGGWSPELERAIKESRVTDIIVQHWNGKDLSFLKEFAPQIRQFWIQARVEDISVINCLDNLEDLSFHDRVEQVDFSKLRKLRTCGIEARSAKETIGNLGSSPNLEELTLVLPRIMDLACLSTLKKLRVLDLQEIPLESLKGIERLTRLEKLCIRQCGLGSLDGIQHATRLQFLMLVHLRKLANIGALVGLKSLTYLDITASKNIKNIETLGRMTSLQTLVLDNQGELPSISFLTKLSSLEKLNFLDSSNVLDGKLNFLLQLPRLKTVSFKNRKHYSHKVDEINQFLNRREAAI